MLKMINVHMISWTNLIVVKRKIFHKILIFKHFLRINEVSTFIIANTIWCETQKIRGFKLERFDKNMLYILLLLCFIW